MVRRDSVLFELPQDRIGNVKVGVDVDGVLVAIERLIEPEDLGGNALLCDLHGVFRDLNQFLGGDLELGVA